MASLKDQRVLVVGASSGMGMAIARAAADAGAAVTGTGSTPERSEWLKQQLPEIDTAALDLGSAASIDAFADMVDAVDHVAVTAQAKGAARTIEPLETADFNAMRAVFEIKLFGMLALVQKLIPKLSASGSVTLFSGAASRRTIPGHVGLGAVNGAIEAAGRQLAKEIAPARVNVISPGLVRTEAYDAMPKDQREAMFKAREAALPVGRIGDPSDIAQATIHLMSNGYVSGIVMDVDGGGQLT